MQKLTYFLSLVLLLSMVAMGFYIWQNEHDKAQLKQELETQSQTSQAQPTETPILGNTPAPTSTTAAGIDSSGIIMGSISFPSEVIPDMEICAQNTTTQDQICTSEILEEESYTYGKGYRLEVPAGTYHVFAKLPNDPYQAYYDEFVTCGLKQSCPSHEPIDVAVDVGETVTGIDPQDWYNQ